MKCISVRTHKTQTCINGYALLVRTIPTCTRFSFCFIEFFLLSVSISLPLCISFRFSIFCNAVHFQLDCLCCGNPTLFVICCGFGRPTAKLIPCEMPVKHGEWAYGFYCHFIYHNDEQTNNKRKRNTYAFIN